MATETQTSGDIPISDYQAIPKPVERLSPEAQFAPTCMMWCITLGLGLMVCMVLSWAASSEWGLSEIWRMLTSG